MPTKKRHVVVTTEHRGVFFGTLTAEDTAARTATLGDAQMCVYWSEDVQGVVGLAATGPTARCRVSRPAPSIALSGTTAVMDATPEATKAWTARPWR